MTNFKYIFFSFTLLFITKVLFSQEERFNTEFINSNFISNPSMPNDKDEITSKLYFTTIIDKKIPGLKRDVNFNLQYPLLKGLISGVNVSNQSSGILQYQHVNLNFAVDIKISNTAHLNTGYSLGNRNFQVNQSSNNLNTVSNVYYDPVVLNSLKNLYKFYTGIGTTYYNKNLAIQFVYPNLTTFFSKIDSAYEVKPLFLNFSYFIPFNSNDYMEGDRRSSLSFDLGYYQNDLMLGNRNKTLSFGAKYNTIYNLDFNFSYNTTGVFNTGVGFNIYDKYLMKINYLIGGVYSTVLYGGNGIVLIGFSFRTPRIRPNY